MFKEILLINIVINDKELKLKFLAVQTVVCLVSSDREILLPWKTERDSYSKINIVIKLVN